MRSYLIHGDKVTVCSSKPKKVGNDAIVVRRLGDLDATRFPLSRLVALWNALPNVTTITRLRSRDVGLKRLWEAWSALPVGAGVRKDSKQNQLISLLQRPEGACLDELMSATGWQAHSVRGVLSGVLRKKLGLEIERITSGNTSAYRIVAA